MYIFWFPVWNIAGSRVSAAVELLTRASGAGICWWSGLQRACDGWKKTAFGRVNSSWGTGLDCSFKIFRIFNMEYPANSIGTFFCFHEHHVYKIKRVEKIPQPPWNFTASQQINGKPWRGGLSLKFPVLVCMSVKCRYCWRNIDLIIDYHSFYS